MGVLILPWEGEIFRGKDMPVHARQHCAVSFAKWLNQSRVHLGCGLGWAQGSMSWGCTSVPLGKYYRTVHVRRRCGLFDKLLQPLVIIIKGIYKAQDRLRATNALCRQRKCLLSTHCQNSFKNRNVFSCVL